jgi:tetratricopeptide (TPR) repeat protein
LPASEEANYLSNLASTYIQNGTPQKAIEISNQALKLDQDDESAKWNRALAYLELGDYENGFPGLECGRKKERGTVKQYHENGTPFWDGTPGQTIVVYGEQGIGDEIMFASMLPDIMRDCRVILDAHTRLADLFRINYPDNPVYGTRETANIPWAKLHKNIDAKIEIGSLAKFYRKKESDFPKNTYLRADEKYVKKYWKKLDSMGNKPKIGISWKGGILATGAINRCIPLEMLKDILRMQEIDFISLQYNLDIYEKEVKPFEDKYHICLNHWQDAIDSYDETAGLVANLDLIISVPQSVVHLAGALGTMAWQLCPKKAMWQLGPYGKNPPWYGCVENIWQDDSERWEPVIHQVKERLCNLLLTTTGN